MAPIKRRGANCLARRHARSRLRLERRGPRAPISGFSLAKGGHPTLFKIIPVYVFRKPKIQSVLQRLAGVQLPLLIRRDESTVFRSFEDNLRYRISERPVLRVSREYLPLLSCLHLRYMLLVHIQERPDPVVELTHMRNQQISSENKPTVGGLVIK